MKITVECTLLVEVEMPDDMEMGLVQFIIEENSCPGTGRVGGVIEDAIEKGERESTCWACALQGRNRIKAVPNEAGG